MDDDAIVLWTPEGRERYEAALASAVAALETHARAVRAASADDTLQLILTAQDVEEALDQLSDAEYRLTGAASFWLDDPESEDGHHHHDHDHDHSHSHGHDHDEVAEGACVVDLQLSMDLDDTDQLLGWARQNAEDETVESVEDAIFVAANQVGWDGLLADQVPGITMQGAVATVRVAE